MAVLIKIGGAAITNKKEKHSIKKDSLEWFGFLIKKYLKMNQKIIIVHGAGSFGHFEAKEYKIDQGSIHKEFNIGFTKTRQAVLLLNQTILKNLVQNDIPATSISPISYFSSKNEYSSEFIKHIQKLIDFNIIPLIHGDVIFDKEKGCSILSGDVLMEIVSEHIKPERVIFISDVYGIYQNPPTESDEKTGNGLIRIIEIDKQEKFKFDKNENDVTGGIEQKFSSASIIAKMNIPVFIVKSESIGAENSILEGNLKDEKGTLIIKNK